MKLYFAGGEVGSHRRLLEDNGHRTIAMSYVGLSRRNKFTKPWIADGQFAPSTEILLDSGAFSLNKDDARVTEQQAIALSITTGYSSRTTRTVSPASPSSTRSSSATTGSRAPARTSTTVSPTAPSSPSGT